VEKNLLERMGENDLAQLPKQNYDTRDPIALLWKRLSRSNWAS